MLHRASAQMNDYKCHVVIVRYIQDKRIVKLQYVWINITFSDLLHVPVYLANKLHLYDSHGIQTACIASNIHFNAISSFGQQRDGEKFSYPFNNHFVINKMFISTQRPASSLCRFIELIFFF